MRYIKYKRFVEQITIENTIQNFFDRLIADGWEIIFYNEKQLENDLILIIVVAGKRQIKSKIL